MMKLEAGCTLVPDSPARAVGAKGLKAQRPASAASIIRLSVVTLFRALGASIIALIMNPSFETGEGSIAVLLPRAWR
jgi:hypothetical protein